MTEPFVFSLTATGLEVAERVGKALGCGVTPGEPDAVRAAFSDGRALVGVCAAGILIRLVAPLLENKRAEPPVIAISTDGAHVVPLLGGHHGANALAREIAALLGGAAAITTASDARFARALDEPPAGYVLANPEAAKAAMKALIDGAAIALEGEMGWLAAAGYPLDSRGQVRVRVTHLMDDGADGALIYHPKVLVAGMGAARGAPADEAIALLSRVLAEKGLAPQSLAAIGTLDLKADEAALDAVTQHFGAPLRVFSAQELDEESKKLPNPSQIVQNEIGIPGVAEAVALKAGTILNEKVKSRSLTCAVGLAQCPLDIASFGRARGRVHLVGIGPGEAAQRTAAAAAALRESSDWVGYGLYLDLVADLKRGQSEHRFGLGDEEPRVRHALELAATGREVALICSGDAQIYAMAALAFELLEADGARALSDAARRVAVEVHPGISALQMASARVGALIGHDFCAISLSDLLTPREAIINRLEAAARGDFVTAFYNPRSLRRTDLIETAKAVYLAHRPADTPVIVARSLGRPDESVRVTTLKDFAPEQIDMMTIVLFGASTSRAFLRGDGRLAAYTPRGYAKKALGDAAE